MSLPVVLRDEAQRDFDEAFDWYDAHRAGLGVEFLAEVQRAFDFAAENPQANAVVFADIHQVAVRRFPYRIFYRVHANRLEVMAVFHASRDPRIWQGRA